MIEIIPAIDLIDGRCVRLKHGRFDQKTVYSDDPVAVAQEFQQCGLRRLHVVDLDGARTGWPANLGVLQRIASKTQLIIDFGGGLASTADVQAAYDAGASIVNVGSVAVAKPDLFRSWLDQFGADRILLAADSREGKVAVDGWQTETSVDLITFLRANFEIGVRRAFVTDITRDGAMAGPSIELYRSLIDAVPALKLIASGGVTSMADIEQLGKVGCSATIVGKAIYEGQITYKELAAHAG